MRGYRERNLKIILEKNSIKFLFQFYEFTKKVVGIPSQAEKKTEWSYLE